MRILNLPPIEEIQSQNQQTTPHSKQRTDEWFKKRLGLFTGSEIHKLMSCSRSTARMEWGRPEKLVDFGETAKKYIFAKAKERQRGKVVKMPTTAAMIYGTENEETVKKMLDFEINEVSFKEFLPGVAGSSPDGYVEEGSFGLEIKCATGWDGLYDRHENNVDQKHKDFWQLQSEMLSLNVNKMLYVVAEPSEDIFDPEITDLSMMWVHASKIHQQAIIERSKIGDKVIKEWIKNDGKKNITDCLMNII